MRNLEKALGYKPSWENRTASDKIIYGAYYKKYRKEFLKYLKNKGYNLLVAGEKSNYGAYYKYYPDYPDFEYAKELIICEKKRLMMYWTDVHFWNTWEIYMST